MTTIGERIRERRLALGLSQRDLASEGVSYAYISRLEANARQPSIIRALRKLAPKLGVSVHWLETGKDDPAEQLARFVLEHRTGPPPRWVRTLARQVLRGSS
jgi:transcriptional regulator with XRE-family HTH domain